MISPTFTLVAFVLIGDEYHITSLLTLTVREFIVYQDKTQFRSWRIYDDQLDILHPQVM